MREHYDFSKAQKNPYAKRLKQQVTIRLDESTLEYFQALYLRDCAARRKKLSMSWKPAS